MQSLLARATHDNTAGLPQELSFRAGDILSVMHQNPEGYDGWWICSMHGKVGIAPGNRLEVVGYLKNEGETGTLFDEHAYDIPVEIPHYTKYTGTSYTDHQASNGYTMATNDVGSLTASDKNTATRRSYYENFPAYSDEEDGVTPDDSAGNTNGTLTSGQHLPPSIAINTQQSPPYTTSYDESGNYDNVKITTGNNIIETHNRLQVSNVTVLNNDISSDESYSLTKIGPNDLDTSVDNTDPRTGLPRRFRNGTSPTRNKLSVRFKDPSPTSLRSSAPSPGPATVTSGDRGGLSLTGIRKDHRPVTPTFVAKSQSSNMQGTEYGDYYNMRSANYGHLPQASSSSLSSSDNAQPHLFSSTSNSSATVLAGQAVLPKESSSSGNSSLPNSTPSPKLQETLSNNNIYRVPPNTKSNPSYSDPNFIDPIFRNSTSSNSTDDPSIRADRNAMEILKRISYTSSDSVDSAPFPSNGDEQKILLSKEVALDTFDSTYRNVTLSCTRLFRFIHSKWKTEESLRDTGNTLQSTCHILASHLTEFIEFSQGVLTNARECVDRFLAKKIWKHLGPLQTKFSHLCDAVEQCDFIHWDPVIMSRRCLNDDTDYLGHIVNHTRSISIEVRSLNTAIHANATFLFPTRPSLTHIHAIETNDIDNDVSNSRRSRQQPTRTLGIKTNSYDRGHPPINRSVTPVSTTQQNQTQQQSSAGRFRQLQNRPNSACSMSSSAGGSHTPTPARNNYIPPFTTVPSSSHSLVGHSEASEDGSITSASGCGDDSQTFKLYSAQLESHGDILGSTMEEMLKCLAQHQSPAVFVAHSKFLLKSATQMVHVGHALTTALSDSCSKQRRDVEASSNALCESLKAVVQETKRAAAEFPSLGAVQNLVVAVGRVRETAFHLRRTVRKAAVSTSSGRSSSQPGGTTESDRVRV